MAALVAHQSDYARNRGAARPLPASSLPDQTEDEENQHGTEDGADPAYRPGHAEGTGDETADEGARDAEERGEDQAATVLAGHEELGDGTNDEADDESYDEIDGVLLGVGRRPARCELPGNGLKPCRQACP